MTRQPAATHDPAASASPIRWDIVGYFLGLAVALHAPTDADPDLWGHLRFGLDKIAAGKVIATDSYSYLTGVDAERPIWINHEWLSEVLFAAAWRAGGSPAVIALKLLVVLMIHALGYRILLRAGFGAISAGLILVALAVPLGAGLRFARPQIFTFWLFFIVCDWIVSIETRGARPSRFGLPILFAIWANLHGGVLAGLALISVWLTTQARRPQARRHAVIVLGCWLACLLNPYGWRLLEFLLREATGPRPEIADWAPLDARDWRSWSYRILVLAGAWTLVRPREVCWRLLIVFAMIAMAPLAAVRHLPLFALATLAIASPYASGLTRNFRAACRSRLGIVSRLEQSWGWSLCGLMLLMLVLGREGGRIPYDRPGDAPMPAAAVHALKRSGMSGGLAIHFDWGEYAIWRLASSNIRVSIDGRRETVYSRSIYQENLDWVRGVGVWDRLLQRPETRAALVSKAFPVYGLMRCRSDWVLAFEDEACAIFARSDSWELRVIRDPPKTTPGSVLVDDGAFP